MTGRKRRDPAKYAPLYLESMRDELIALEDFKGMITPADVEHLQLPPYKLPDRAQRLIVSAITRLAEAGKNLIGTEALEPLAADWFDEEETQLIAQLIAFRNIAQHGYLESFSDSQLWQVVNSAAVDELHRTIHRLCQEHL